MRKTRLDLDVLAVESFSTDAANGKPAGTVMAHQESIPTLHTGYHGCYGCVGSVYGCGERA